MKRVKRAQVAAALARTAATFGQGHAKRSLLSMTIQEKTANQYRSKLLPLEDFLIAREKRAIVDTTPLALQLTEEDYHEYLFALVTNHMPIPAGMHSALRKQQEVLGIPMWTETDSCRAALRGAKYRGGVDSTDFAVIPRGTLSPDMWETLVNHTKQVRPNMAQAIVVQYGCDLRISQLVALRSNTYL